MKTGSPIAERQVRWPILEICLLALFPILFKGPDALQRIYGQLPHPIQLVTPFLIGGFVAISSLILTVRGIRAKTWGHAVTSATCTVLGVLCIIFTIAVIRAFGG